MLISKKHLTALTTFAEYKSNSRFINICVLQSTPGNIVIICFGSPGHSCCGHSLSIYCPTTMKEISAVSPKIKQNTETPKMATL